MQQFLNKSEFYYYNERPGYKSIQNDNQFQSGITLDQYISSMPTMENNQNEELVIADQIEMIHERDDNNYIRETKFGLNLSIIPEKSNQKKRKKKKLFQIKSINMSHRNKHALFKQNPKQINKNKIQELRIMYGSGKHIKHYLQKLNLNRIEKRQNKFKKTGVDLKLLQKSHYTERKGQELKKKIKLKDFVKFRQVNNLKQKELLYTQILMMRKYGAKLKLHSSENRKLQGLIKQNRIYSKYKYY